MRNAGGLAVSVEVARSKRNLKRKKKKPWRSFGKRRKRKNPKLLEQTAVIVMNIKKLILRADYVKSARKKMTIMTNFLTNLFNHQKTYIKPKKPLEPV
jgi:hypothetical protein